MTQRREVNRAVVLGLIDVALTLLAFYLSSWARYSIPWGVLLPWEIVVLPWQVYLMVSFIWPIVLSLASVYNVRPHAYRRIFVEIRSLFLGVGLALLVLAGLLYFSYRQVPRRLFFYFGVIDLCLLVLARTIVHLLRRAAGRNGHAYRLLIAGAGQVGREITRQVQRHSDGWQLVGFLDDDQTKAGSRIAGIPVLGPLDAL